MYTTVKPVQYPKAGQVNSAGRVGIVSAGGGTTTWLNVPGDPRNNYIARMDWADNSGSVVLEHLNRLQDTLDLMIGDAHTGSLVLVSAATTLLIVVLIASYLPARRAAAIDPIRALQEL